MRQLVVNTQEGNEQELIKSNPISHPQNQKGKYHTHTVTNAHARHAQWTEWTTLSRTEGHSATTLNKTAVTAIFTTFHFELQNRTKQEA